MHRIAPLLLALGLTVALAGCAGYRLGTGSEPRYARIFVPPVTSDILLPQAQALVTTQLREAFLKDGRTSLADSAVDADAILSVRLAGYQRNMTVVRPDDTGLARRFEISLRARLSLTDRRTGQAVFTDRVLIAKSGAFTDSGQLQSEYQTLPVLAEELARQAVRATLETW